MFVNIYASYEDNDANGWLQIACSPDLYYAKTLYAWHATIGKGPVLLLSLDGRGYRRG
jgi:hypothetical protein